MNPFFQVDTVEFGWSLHYVAPITQYTHISNKKNYTQGSSPDEVEVIFHTLKNCS